MNFNLGYGTLPSTRTENLINMMRASRTDPIRDTKAIQVAGDVKTYVPNQAVSGGVAMINPAIREVRQIPFISDRRRTPVKTENKIKDRDPNIALWDTRNGTSLNNATRLPANYYTDKLKEHAQTKVRMTNTAEAMRVQYDGDREDYITGNTRIDTHITPSKCSLEGFDVGSKDDGTLRYADLCTQSSGVSFNPYLSIASCQGLAGQHGDPSKVSYPDERMSRYSGERKYMTKGDRIMMAADLARSDRLKERRQLQAQAHDSLTGAAHAPRMLGADLSKGINTTNTYARPPSQLKDARVKDVGDVMQVNNYALDSQWAIGAGLSENEQGVGARRNVETYVPRTNDMNRQQSVQQAVDTYYTPGIEQIQTQLNNADIVRKLYVEQFGQQLHKDNPISRLITTIKGWIWSDENDKFRSHINSEDTRKHSGNIDQKTFNTTIQQLAEVMEKDELSLQQRQLFHTDVREQVREYIQDYHDNIHYDAIIHDILNNIAERCLINDGSIRRFDEDKFVEVMLSTPVLMERLDELKNKSADGKISDKNKLLLRQVCEDYDAEIVSGWADMFGEAVVSAQFGTRNKHPNVPLYYAERGVKQEYSDNIKRDSVIREPIAMLDNGNGVVKSMLVRDVDKDKCILLQRREGKEDYILATLDTNDVLNVLGLQRQEMKLDGKFKDVYDLTFEDHVRLIDFIDSTPNQEFIITTKSPIHPYQRDLLDDADTAVDVGVISNVLLIDGLGEVRKSENVIQHSSNIATFTGDPNTCQQLYQTKDDRQNANDRLYVSARTQTQMNPSKMYQSLTDRL